MHFPWKKKSRVCRISKLVAGIQSPKHKSLVVETGFPTSLIDLFVKNRDRLNKSSSTRKTDLENCHELEISSPQLVNSAENSVIEGETVRRSNGEVIGGIRAVELLEKDQKRNIDNGSEFNCVFVWILKVFVVVVLGLCAKKLALGITLSACLLMFVEYFGRFHSVSLGFESVFRGVGLRFVRFRHRKLVSRWSVFEANMLLGCESEQRGSVGEIEIADNELNRVDKDCVEEGRMGCSGQVLLKECLELERKMEVEDDGEIVECKNENKGRGERRSVLIKKFVQKKLQCRNKKNKGKILEGASEDQESFRDKNAILSSGHEETEKVDNREVHKQDSGIDGISQGSQELENYKEGWDSGQLFKREADVSAAEVKMDGERKQNSGYIFLFLIVLAGLLGGRMVALVVTMAWFSFQKLVYKLSGFDNAASKGFRAGLG